jgi:hypothetical protein
MTTSMFKKEKYKTVFDRIKKDEAVF